MWKLRSRPGEGPIGELTEGGLFKAVNPGEAMVVALAPGDDDTRQDETFVGEIPALGTAELRGVAFVEVLPVFTAIEGRVISSNDQPVRGAFVFAKGLPDFAVTEFNGWFFIPLVPPDQPIELTVVYDGAVVATHEVAVPEGEIEEVEIVANVEVDPPPARPVHAIGRILKPDATGWQYGTHILRGDLIVPCCDPVPLPHGRDETIVNPDLDDDDPITNPDIMPPPEPIIFALQSEIVDLDEFLDTYVEIVGTRVEGHPVDGGPPLLEVREVRPLVFAAAEAGAHRPRPHGGPALGGPGR